MRRTLFPFILVIALIAGISVTSSADGPVSLSFDSVETDSAYTVTLNANNLTGIAMMQFNVTYDASKLQCKSAGTGTALQGNTGPTINSSVPGEIIFVWDSLTSLKADGSLLVMNFERIADGNVTVGIDTNSTVIFADTNFNLADYSCSPVVLRGTEQAVTPTATVAPTATAKPAASPTATSAAKTTSTATATVSPTATATVKSASASTAAPSPTATAAPTATPSGVNGEGLTLNTNSAQLSQGESAQLTVSEGTTAVYSSSNESVATVDESGNVTAVGEGSAIITVYNEDGSSYSTCYLEVEGADGAASEEQSEITGTDGDAQAAETTESPAVIIAVFIAAIAAGAAVIIIMRKRNGKSDEEQN